MYDESFVSKSGSQIFFFTIFHQFVDYFLSLFYSTVSQRIFSPPLPWIHIIGSVFNEVSISILINSRAKVEQFKKELFIFPGKIGGNFSPGFAQFHLRAFCN